MSWTWVNVERIHLVWVALVVVGVLFALELAHRNALATFLSPIMQRRLTDHRDLGRTIAKLVFVLGAMGLSIAALMRPQSRGDVEEVVAHHARTDVMFLLDVSRSMLAEDVAPSRFARAKVEIANLVEQLEGERVGLIAFAGRAAMVCPLTPDRSFFRTVLATVETGSTGNRGSAGRGGTKIGEAIKTAVRAFPSEPGARLIVLVTDGDDQDPYSEEAAKLARDAGVHIITMGLGNEQGSEITLTDPKTRARTTLMHDGKPVISKLNGEQLRKIATLTEGAYIPAGTSAIDLDSIMTTHVKPLAREAQAATRRFIPTEKYPWFVAGALACLLLALWMGADRKAL
jgi:uncharacterized protein YegL